MATPTDRNIHVCIPLHLHAYTYYYKQQQLLGIPYIYGNTREAERQRILGLFRLNTLVNCIGLSKVSTTLTLTVNTTTTEHLPHV
jgi:ERCC3/RAD25/XPB C-terminal helicase